MNKKFSFIRNAAIAHRDPNALVQYRAIRDLNVDDVMNHIRFIRLKNFPDRFLDIPAPIYRGILAALSQRDPSADICLDPKGNPESDPDLRDTESVPLPKSAPFPLPIGYKGANGKEPANDKLVKLVRTHCDAYFAREVAPHWPDAWIDYSKTRAGYEISINRHFYVYQPPRRLEVIEDDIRTLEASITSMLKEVA